MTDPARERAEKWIAETWNAPLGGASAEESMLILAHIATDAALKLARATHKKYCGVELHELNAIPWHAIEEGE